MIYKLLATFLLSMTPVGELRAGIPYGIAQGLPPILTFIAAVAGNMIPVFFLLWGLPRVDYWLGIKASAFHKQSDQNNISGTARNIKRLKPKFFSFLSRAYCWCKSRTERKYSKLFQRLGAIALIVFVAIPLPLTGGWSGALAAHIFRIPPKKSAVLILIGVIIAGIIVSLISLNIF